MVVPALFALFTATSTLLNVLAQSESAIVPSSFPHVYPNKPAGDFSPAWQNCKQLPIVFSTFRSLAFSDFEVTDLLPNVTWTLPRNWAGNIPVQRVGHDNNTLFFWAFEKENGSLTASADENLDKPWGIWLNGYVDEHSPFGRHSDCPTTLLRGPGSSSMAGLMLEVCIL
jgi:carboxypeptidase D